MTVLPEERDERLARAALACVGEPGDPVLGALLRIAGPARTLSCIKARRMPPAIARAMDTPGQVVGSRISAWHARLGRIPGPAILASDLDPDMRLLCPGDPGWPVQRWTTSLSSGLIVVVNTGI